jgi:hypothetical protein
VKRIYYTPGELWERIRNQAHDITKAQKALDEAMAVHNALVDALEESYDRIDKGLPTGVTVDEIVCHRCNDTHSIELSCGLKIMCTFCPTPCAECRCGGYCSHTPCHCDCHKKG